MVLNRCDHILLTPVHRLGHRDMFGRDEKTPISGVRLQMQFKAILDVHKLVMQHIAIVVHFHCERFETVLCHLVVLSNFVLVL